MDRKILWYEALRGGTIIGIVMSALSAVSTAMVAAEKSGTGWISALGFVLFIMLVYAFTRRVSRAAEPSTGFSYGRCMTFTLMMMLFAGVIAGAYQTLANNFFFKQVAEDTLNQMLVILQDMTTDDQFDAMEVIYTKMIHNPLAVVFSSVFSYLIYGALAGLVTSAIAATKPDIFADSPSQNQQGVDSSSDKEDNNNSQE